MKHYKRLEVTVKILRNFDLYDTAGCFSEDLSASFNYISQICVIHFIPCEFVRGSCVILIVFFCANK